MVQVAKKYQDELERLKKMVQADNEYFKKNRERYHEFREFVFNTSVTADDMAVLKTLLKPTVECNIMEAFISRLRGEFSKQQPSITISGADGKKINPDLISFLEGHWRWLLYQANNDSFEYEVYTDLLSGGFSAMELWTQYKNEMSFEQEIKIGRPYDVTMTGFDPLARKSHKGDGRYWFKLFPKTEDEFKEEYPDVDISDINFTRSIEGFDWSFNNNKEKILLICEFYEKKQKRRKLYKLADGSNMYREDYEEELEKWNEAIQRGLTVMQPPTIVKERWAMETTVCRYTFIENQVLEYIETDFCQLNGVFVDGNSVYLRDAGAGAARQMTRPYAWHAKGIQQTKNYALQTLANELENLVQHKLMMPLEAIPDAPEYSDAYTNLQIPNLVVYQAYNPENPQQPLPPPQMVVRPPIPPEIMQTFQMCDQSMQMVLGSFDSALGINNNQLSGIAIVEGATQSNSAAMPFIVGFLQGLNQLAQIYLDTIPKYMKTPQTVPVMDAQGKRAWVQVNKPDGSGVQLNYDSNELHVRVEAGVNFAVQKSRALQQIIQLSQANQMFGQFISSMGLDVLLDNLEIRGLDQLTERAQMFMKQLQHQQQMAAQQPNPAMMQLQLKQQELQQHQQQNQSENQLKVAQIQNDANANNNDRLKIMLAAQQSNQENVVEMAKTHAENVKSSAELAIKTHDHALKIDDQQHQHEKDALELGHKIMTTLQPPTETTGDTKDE